jgi:4-nitrophenyl phosphatase
MTDLHLTAMHAFLLDLDGVVFRGGQALPGALQFVAHLQSRAIPFLFITNNSTRTPAAVVEKLARMGLLVSEGHVLTSSLATAGCLARRAPRNTPVYVIGEDGVRDALTSSGLCVVADHAQAEYVVVGHDTGLTWRKLADAALAIGRGAGFIGTNPDRTLPIEEGLVPGAGAILAALEAATGVSPEVIGKPQPAIFEHALHILGADAQSTVMIGDRLDTDIVGAINAGLRTVGVLTGVSTAEEFRQASTPPDWIVEDLCELLARWQAAEIPPPAL